jgi:hypothetical protein
MRLHSSRVFLIFAVGAVMAVAACSSSGGGAKPSASASSPPAPTSAAPATSATSAAPSSPSGGSAAAVTEIKTNWEAFFNPKTPVAKRVSLLQNGQVFEPIIKAQAGSPLASSATSSVSSVTVESPAQAKVVYSILVGGSPALNNQPGVAVFQNGIWKVGDQSFCALLTLENSGKAPSVCASAAG